MVWPPFRYFIKPIRLLVLIIITIASSKVFFLSPKLDHTETCYIRTILFLRIHSETSSVEQTPPHMWY